MWHSKRFEMGIYSNMLYLRLNEFLEEFSFLIKYLDHICEFFSQGSNEF